MASYLAKPKAFPKKRLIGPWLEGKNWGPLKGVIREALGSHEADPTQRGGSKVELCWRRWCRQAEGEIVANLDLGDEEEKYVGRQKGPRLVMKPVTGWTGTRSKGASTKKGVVARVQATRLGEVVKCIWAARRKEAAGEGVSKLRRHIRRLMPFLGDYMTKHQNEEGCEQWAPKAQQLKQWGLLKEVEKWTEVFTISRWAAEARVMAEVEEHEARSRRQESWQEWVKKASEKGAAGLHSWIKEPRPWVPAAVTVGQEITYSPSDVAEDCLGGWAQIWEAGKEEEALVFEDWEADEVTEITGERLRKAVAKFPEKTGMGMCGWHPKDWDKVGEEALECLAHIMSLAEATGCWPGTQKETAMVRIGKEGGGVGDYRLIGLMPTLYRVWAKLRRDERMAWEEKNARCYDFASKGRGAISEVWDVALMDEGARVQKADTACWAADLSKFYERIPLKQLISAAKDLGFPSKLLRMALGIYRGARSIQYERACSSAVFASNGVIAGCSLATTLVKVFMWRTLDAARGRFPGIRLKVYLDDILLRWVGHLRNGRFVQLSTLIKAIVYYSEAICDEMKAELNTGKTCLVSSNKQVLKLLEGRLRGLGVAAGEGCRLLGVDYACGARRRLKAIARRKEKASKKCRRIGRLSKTRADRGMLWTTGVGPSVAYGAEVFGVNGQELQRMRKQAGRVGLPGGGGRSLSIGFLCHHRKDIDPMWTAGIAPAITWCKEAWRRTEQLAPLRLAWQHAAQVMPHAKREWSRVIGPATATWASLRRLGWSFTGPTVFEDNEGSRLDLIDTSPLKMKERLLRAARQWTLKTD